MSWASGEQDDLTGSNVVVPLAQYADLASRLGPLPALQRRMDACESVGELLAVASVEAPRACGFERGIVLSVIDGCLSSNGMGVIGQDASDALRRRCETQPIALTSDCEETELIRRANGGRRARATAGSAAAHALDLECHAMSAVVPENHALALVVLDRCAPRVTDEDRAVVDLFAYLLGLAVIRVVLRVRIDELSREFQHLSVSATALMHEAQAAPISLTTDLGQGPVFTATGQRAAPAAELTALLSEREHEILERLVEGRSNREIAEELHVAPDTVKAHVARLLRKLHVSNRVEAAARYSELHRSAG